MIAANTVRLVKSASCGSVREQEVCTHGNPLETSGVRVLGARSVVPAVAWPPRRAVDPQPIDLHLFVDQEVRGSGKGLFDLPILGADVVQVVVPGDDDAHGILVFQRATQQPIELLTFFHGAPLREISGVDEDVGLGQLLAYDPLRQEVVRVAHVKDPSRNALGFPRGCGGRRRRRRRRGWGFGRFGHRLELPLGSSSSRSSSSIRLPFALGCLRRFIYFLIVLFLLLLLLLSN
mmetsp:Transcript_14875/g.28062  ORF Transcript_14875/g.28062 Transcript_14875/m.28062 type:complete len:234 (-) Transcript_14875:34-735(-)